MKKNIILLFLSLFCGLVLIQSCKKNDDESIPDPPNTEPPLGTTFIEPSAQRSGDAQAGYEYLIYGDYVDAGIPYDLYINIFGTNTENLLQRTGDNEILAPGVTALNAPNGVRVVATNCMQCHAQKINGDFVMGLGNSVADFTTDQSNNAQTLDLGVQFTYGANSLEYEAFEPFGRALTAIGPHIVAPKVGLNPAAKLAVVLAAHRDINDLSWQSSPLIPIPDETITSDVPPWWVMKKKNALFYSAGGMGDFARISMASSLMTLQDSTKARAVEQKFVDVMAYIKTLEPPVYPKTIDQEKLARGEVLFEYNCVACHGYHGANSTYPNLLVELDKVGTDPVLAGSNYTDEAFRQWYNNSWFSTFPAAAQFNPGAGYIAPPLDGIWASAPYLHNGSVPTLEDLLDSSQRPVYWERSFDTSDYDFEKVGWNYEVQSGANTKKIYDTTLLGYGNGGHTFGDHFTEEERSDLIEYLKSI